MITLKNLKTINIDDAKNLYDSVGWTSYTSNLSMLKQALNNSLDIVGAYHDDNLIGLIRVVGDGISIIYIQDILIDPNYQRQGIGTTLINNILNKYKSVRQKVLITETEKNTLAFYKSLGFDETNDLNITCFYKQF